MGSVREHRPPESRDRMDDGRPLSPRRSRVMSDREERTLPPISHLLPSIDSPHHGRPRSRASNHSPPSSHYPPLSTSRGSSDHSPSYRYQAPPSASSNSPASPTYDYDSRYQGHSSNDRYDLPYHSRPLADRSHPSHSREAYPGKLAPSSLSSSSSYSAQPSDSRASPYAASGSDSRRRTDDPYTNLPPPPPFHGSSNGHSPYAESRSYASGDGRQDPYRPPPPPQLHQAYQHSYDAPRSYDPRMPPSAGPPTGPYHQPPHAPYSSLPPLAGGHYSSTDEPARKRRGNLPRWTTDIFKAWFLEHIAHPYPSEQEKNDLCAQTGCSMTQISNWFINARRRQTPVLTRQAEAERRLRDTAAGRSSSNSE